MKVVLLGYMASGKSTVGVKLAQKLEFEFVDLDEMIVRQSGLSIAEIFSLKGEIFFRKLETKVLSELLSSQNDLIIAVGGGTPCYGQNMNEITKKSKSIYLKGSLNFLNKRLSHPKRKNKRPLIAHLAPEKLKEFIAKHLFERNVFYDRALFTISIDGKKKKEIVQEILEIL